MTDTGDYFKCIKLPVKIDVWYLSFVELGVEKLFKQDLFEKVTDEKLFEQIRNEKIIKG